MSFELDMMKMPAKFYKQRRASEKMFVIQELFNIENHLKADGDTYSSKEEEYFNRMWSIVIRRIEENNEPKLVVYLKSRKPDGTPAQSMDISMDIKLFTRSYHRPSAHLDVRFNDDKLEELHGTTLCNWEALKLTDEEEKKVGKPKIIPDAELKRLKLRKHIGKPQFVVHCPHAVRIKVNVNKTAFLYGDFMRGTNTPNETKFVVGDTNFYVPKKHFDKLPELFQCAQQPGSGLGKSFEKDVDPLDFQQLLSVTRPSGSLSPIDDSNVEGVLVASSALHATEVVNRCKAFVEEESMKSLEKKFQLALQFGWEELKEKCLLQFESAHQMYDAIPTYLQTLTASKTQEQWEEIVKSNNMKTAGQMVDSDDDEEDEENDEPDDQMDQEENQEEDDRMDQGQPKKVHYVRLVEYSDSDSD
ncbi:hypothetical protein CAEBREN_24417 [Caenorhabditis brenneri]|uniref:MATH domain-containing protein n=1 Tax=Caenorhabditis brenneri TaxID=135651 RepID=G0MMJ7_CAEBE|nr:hypothetical protein CAEBREN_24417 [Caenorhabditis brenneri]